MWADGFNMNLTIRNSTITGNSAGDDGGGMYVEDTGGPLLIENSTFSNNHAADKGGGIYFYDPDHDVTIRNTTISGNTAASRGGGIYFYSPDDGVFTITGSTISGNSAASGGGMYLYAIDHGLIIENTTITGNTATAGAGGGANIPYPATATIRHTTIAGNSATQGGGGLDVTGDESLTIVDTILSGNGTDLATGPGASIDVSYSLIQTPGSAAFNDVAGNLLNTDPQLAPLADNGGPTQTMLPAVGSPVVDAGDPAFAPPPSADQRGKARVAGAHTDMGAVEVDGGTIALSSATYSIAEGGGSLTVTIERTGGTDPATVAYATSDATASAGSDYTATSGTATFAAGATTATFTIPILDDSAVEGDETFSIALSDPSPGAVLGAIANATVTIVDDDFHGTIELSSATYSVGEGDGSLSVTFTRSGGSAGAISATYATSDDSASAPADYAATSGTVNWADGDTAPKTITIPIVDDALVEPSETFSIALSAPAGGATIGAIGTATATIVDNDVAPAGTVAFTIGAVTVNETSGNATVQVARSGGSAGAVSVDFATANGSAVAGSDYGSTSGTLTWPDGDTTPRTITIPIVADGIPEPAETFDVTLSNASGGTIGSPATVTITIGAQTAAVTTPAPGLGSVGQWLLGALLAIAGIVTRRRGKAALLAAGLALGAAGSHDASAGEARVRSAPVRAVTSITSIERANGEVHVKLANGTELRVPENAVQIRDHRKSATSRTSTSSLAAGETVLVKTRDEGGGRQKVKIRIFDNAEAAQRALARRDGD
ncbi:MAG TPA: Calx-beta domain-containing protein [Rudaea sp.]